MRLRILAPAFLLTTTAAFAQTLTPLEQGLGQLPEMILTNPGAEQAIFINVAALQTLLENANAQASASASQRLMLGQVLPPLRALYLTDIGTWNKKAGIDLKSVRYFTGLGMGPHNITVWGLANDDAAAQMLDTLKQRGFSPVGTKDILGNGKPMEINPSRDEPGNPWMGSVGASTFVAAHGNAVFQASAPEILPKLVAGGPNAGGAAAVKAATTGLKAAIGDHPVVQAMLFSPALGVMPGDPAQRVLSGKLGATSTAAPANKANVAIPPYLGGLIADVQLDTPAVVVSLAYADCDLATRAADSLAQRWNDTLPASAQGATKTATVPSADGHCAATLIISSKDPAITGNPVFKGFYQQYQQRQFRALQISQTK